MNKKGPLIALLVLVVIAGGCLYAWRLHRPETSEGSKTVTVQVIHGDGAVKEAEATTEAEYLGEVLLELEELSVEGESGPYGLYITSVDGESASDADRTYWRVSCDGEDLIVGADSQPVADGEHYELTLTTW